MERIFKALSGKKNFVFVGEAGGGKSEVAMTFARKLAERSSLSVHFFDLDMTKPLFRSRDAAARLEAGKVAVHFMEQFMDAPTLVGGVSPLLRDPGCLTVLDVGGDYIGARSIGGFAPWLNRPETAVLYVVNAFRPWSDTIEHIDGTLGRILGVSHVRLEQLTVVSNPNNGITTRLEEFLAGHSKTVELISPYLPVAFACAREDIAAEAAKLVDVPVLPIRLELAYPWLV